jgi:hypothetical protein
MLASFFLIYHTERRREKLGGKYEIKLVISCEKAEARSLKERSRRSLSGAWLQGNFNLLLISIHMKRLALAELLDNDQRVGEKGRERKNLYESRGNLFAFFCGCSEWMNDPSLKGLSRRVRRKKGRKRVIKTCTGGKAQTVTQHFQARRNDDA